jgi:glutathione S-transferase
MTDLTLLVYDKNYSSWSMRAGLALRLVGAPFREVSYKIADAATQADLKRRAPAGLFPVLEHGDVRVWDSLAILEYLAELFPAAGLWPAEHGTRAAARSVAAEIHAGFAALRQSMPMNIRARYPRFPRPLEVDDQARRVVAIWRACRERSAGGGPFLFGAFGAADCMFAPDVMRFRTYDVKLDAANEAYARAVEEHPAVRDWVREARAEAYSNAQFDLVVD